MRLLVVDVDKFPELTEKISDLVSSMAGSSAIEEPSSNEPIIQHEFKRCKVGSNSRKDDNNLPHYSHSGDFMLADAGYSSIGHSMPLHREKEPTQPPHVRAMDTYTSRPLEACTSRGIDTYTSRAHHVNNIPHMTEPSRTVSNSTHNLAPEMLPISMAPSHGNITSATPSIITSNIIIRTPPPILTRDHNARWPDEPPRFVDNSSYSHKHIFSTVAQTDSYWGYNEFSTQTVGREHQSFGTQTMNDFIEDPDLDSFLVECLDGAVQTENTNKSAVCFGSQTTSLSTEDFVPTNQQQCHPTPYVSDRLDRHCQTNYYTNSTHTQTNIIRERALIVTDGLNIETQTLSCDPEDFVSSYNERFTQTTQSDGEEQFSIL